MVIMIPNHNPYICSRDKVLIIATKEAIIIKMSNTILNIIIIIDHTHSLINLVGADAISIMLSLFDLCGCYCLYLF